MLDDLVFYASFDREVKGDFGGGALSPGTRFNHETEKGQFVFESGYDPRVFRIAAGEGIHGGALEAADILPRNGRIYFPAKGNLPYAKGGWGGSVSFWMKTDPNTMLKTRFCDPIQITQKGATNGGLWVDFPDTSPRDFRLGAFQSEGNGRSQISESDPDAPLVVVKEVGFKTADWHHIVFTWRNFDTGRDDAEAALYIDGARAGSIGNRAITMDWDIEKTGIYVAVGYIGLLDELAVFRRPLTTDEIAQLGKQPGLLAERKTR
ncbi:MAG: hypothetical protein KIT09_23300 [Bryobacteraceae bacterium]|nr:hypothetical protein [Bryobacteraceae bacterium]